MKRRKNTIGSQCGQVHLLTVNNDEKGNAFISELRERMKGTPNRLVLYGRGHRFGKGRIHGFYLNGTYHVTNRNNEFQDHLPFTGEQKAQRIAVYITSR